MHYRVHCFVCSYQFKHAFSRGSTCGFLNPLASFKYAGRQQASTCTKRTSQFTLRYRTAAELCGLLTHCHCQHFILGTITAVTHVTPVYKLHPRVHGWEPEQKIPQARCQPLSTARHRCAPARKNDARVSWRRLLLPPDMATPASVRLRGCAAAPSGVFQEF